ncbi:MAG TPA: aldo/keto reductase, partial [Bryobacteraceae bacterium]|nr:aldo/keto reductase [Bryobacteraceae bacterium]
MIHRRLGRTGLSVSAISLGTVEIGLNYGIAADGTAERPDESQAARLLHRALDLGINFVDTARAYGESEAIIGRTLRSRRQEFFLCSKVLSFQNEELSPAELRNRVIASVHESLRALQTDVIDMMMIHSAPTEVIVRGDLIGILEDLRAAGCFRFIGASIYGEEAALAAIESGRYDCLQIAYSMLDRRPEQRVIPAAERRDVGLVTRSVLLKGALTHRYRFLPAELDSLKRAVERLAQAAGVSAADLPEAAYRYVLVREIPQTVLVGTGEI